MLEKKHLFCIENNGVVSVEPTLCERFLFLLFHFKTASFLLIMTVKINSYLLQERMHDVAAKASL